MVSFVPNNWKGHLGISVSELCFKNALGQLINNRSNFQEKRIIVRKIAATFREERIITRKFGVNHRTKRIIIRKIARIKTIGVTKCREILSNIVSSEISSKSHEKPGISSKFVCITFAQYCKILPRIQNTSHITEHFPESKTLPRIQKHIQESKTHPRIRNTSDTAFALVTKENELFAPFVQ